MPKIVTQLSRSRPNPGSSRRLKVKAKPRTLKAPQGQGQVQDPRGASRPRPSPGPSRRLKAKVKAKSRTLQAPQTQGQVQDPQNASRPRPSPGPSRHLKAKSRTLEAPPGQVQDPRGASRTTSQVVWPKQQCHSTEGWWLVNQVKGQSTDRPVITARIFVHHYNSTQYCNTEIVLLIFPFLQMWPSEGNAKQHANICREISHSHIINYWEY